MTVAELIKKLETMPQGAEVVVAYYESDWEPAVRVEWKPALKQSKQAYRGSVFIPYSYMTADDIQEEIDCYGKTHIEGGVVKIDCYHDDT